MRAGQLDRRITIEREEQVGTTDFNEPIMDWAELATVWASRHDVSAREAFRAQEVGAELTTRFVIRYSQQVADVNPKDRVVFDGRTYNITAVRDVGRFEAREIDAVARADTEPGS